MLGVAGLPNSIKASQRFPLSQMVWGLMKWQYLRLRWSSQTPPIRQRPLFAILLNIPPSQPYSSPSMVPSSSHPPKLKALKCWICLLPPSLSSTFPPLEPQRTPWRRVKNGWKESVEALNLHGHFTQCLLNSDCTVPQTKSNRGLIWSSHPHFSCCVSLRTPCTSSSLGVCDKTLEI